MLIPEIIDTTTKIDDKIIVDTLKGMSIDEDTIMKAFNNLSSGKCIVRRKRIIPETPNIEPMAIYEVADTQLMIKYYLESPLY